MNDPEDYLPPAASYWSSGRRIALALGVGFTLTVGLLVADWWVWRYAYFSFGGGLISTSPGPPPAFLRDFHLHLPLPPTDPFILIGATLVGVLPGALVYVGLTFLAHRQARQHDL